ncbi:MAG: cupin domain-containing protein [Betaproteobacteria bacterium]|nr:cupin domain-containing protein [Betaproteobacteria bacterium]MBV9361224.1 cupin domain-containing protein [Betaproteobacteria bacterium]
MNLKSTFAVLGPKLGVTPVPATPAHVWPTWERHPAGDEIVCLLSGRATFVLEDGKRIDVGEPGEFVIVPKGTWHTAKTTVPTKMVFVTPGEGTENKPC